MNILKKITLFALCLLLLCGCGKTAKTGAEEKESTVETVQTEEPVTDKAETKEEPATENADEQEAETCLCFCSGATELRIGEEAEPVLAALGEPQGSFESPNCANLGTDIIYYYDILGFELTITEGDSSSWISEINITDDTVKTPEGIYIGMPVDELETLTELAFTREGSTLEATSGNTVLRLQVDENETISAITYSMAE